ncbi:hypothetical protein PENSPDRAFT_691216 [Peniophora sp. CONT]|nr:hypothetical protein PENSPDRAFT_691216 [Peniophora sp. CONT]
MSTSVSSAGNGSTEDSPQTPARISEKTIENAQSAVSDALEVLNVVAEMAENVPYLGAVSKALTAFNEVLEEVDVCKRDCRAATSEAAEFMGLMQEFEAKVIRSNVGREIELRNAFIELGSALLKCLDTLQTIRVDSKRRRDRLKLLLKRGDVQHVVKECRDKIRIAKDKFNMKVAFDTNNMVRELHQRTQLATVSPEPTVAAEPSVWRLRAANPIIYGREVEIETAVDMIQNKAPARVAILGPGGIGKTSIALAVLHHEDIERLYEDWRCFLSCEATTTADAVVRALADALGLVMISDISSETSRHHLISHLKAISGIICLDNFETPLDSDRHAVEELLNEIAALPSITLLITSRDTGIPAIGWTSPPLAHIEPFSQEAALLTWDDICHGHDEYAIKLLDAVDCMPLAVTLLARLASVEGSTKGIWARWETEYTDLVRAGRDDHRLLSVGASIDLSLRSLNQREEAHAVIGIICIFPSGLWDHDISALHDALKDQLSFRRAVTLLKQLSLVYTEPESYKETPMTNVLSPVRHYIRKHHVSDKTFLMLIDVMVYTGGFKKWIEHEWIVILRFGFNRPGPCRERCLDVVISDPRLTNDIEILSQALETRELEPQMMSGLHRKLGQVLRNLNEYENARSSVSKAIKLDEQLGDRHALFDDWLEWMRTYRHEFDGREDECQHLDEMQSVIQMTWNLGRNVDGAWNPPLYFWGYDALTEIQHFINEGRRKLHMPVVHRSGFYSDNDSTVELGFSDFKNSFNCLVKISPPPWEFSSIINTIETPPQSSVESTSSQGSVFEVSVDANV